MVHIIYLYQFRSCQSLSRVRIFVTPWTIACQAPLSMGFSSQEYWSGLHFLLQGIFLSQESNLDLPHCRQILYCLNHQGSPVQVINCVFLSLGHKLYQNFLDGSAGKESACNAGNIVDCSLIPGSEGFPGGGNGNPCLYSYLKMPRTEESGGLHSMGLQKIGHD